ncbi:MAG: putative oligopeptide/dipeptide transporter ATPase subunit [Actinomycetia bacterium]|nr:putative oligopeptide/dipeptide transporter ATPase subunit [Actinomycetes bacterium]
MSPLLSVAHLGKTFGLRKGLRGPREMLQAVDDVSFDIEAGTTLALVGESGAGKSTVVRLVLRLIEPDEGDVMFDGQDVRALNTKDLRSFRRNIQMIFQDPKSSLDPHLSAGASIVEPLQIHTSLGRAEQRRKASEALERVGMDSKDMGRRPADFSGGQLQRIAIARALVLEPKLLVCDEAVSGLDASVRAQVLNLLLDIQKERGLAYLFVTHDLATVGYFSQQIAVMQAGRILEHGPTAVVMSDPQDPYTQELLRAMPRPVPKALRTDASVQVDASVLAATDPNAGLPAERS